MRELAASASSLRAAADTAAAYRRWFGAEIGRFRRKRTAARTRRHALLIAWFMPPSVSSGVHRPSSLLRHAGEHGWRVSVVSGPRELPVTPAGAYLRSLLPKDAEIVTVAPERLRPSWRLFPRIQENYFLQSFSLYSAAVAQFDAAPPDVVIATGPPFCDNIAGYFLAERWGVPLILDYRDEWTRRPAGWDRQGNTDRYWERRTLARADLVILTTESQRQNLLTGFPFVSDQRTAVVENGWEQDDFAALEGLALPRQRGLLAHAGVLHWHTNEESFFSLLRDIAAQDPAVRAGLKVRLIGDAALRRAALLARLGVDDIVETSGQVPKVEALKIMRASSAVLICYGAAMARYIPLKFYDYAASGCPILLYGHPGEVSEIVQTHRLGWFVREGDKTALHAALRDIVAGVAPERAPSAADWLQARTRRRLAERFFDLVARCGAPICHSARQHAVRPGNGNPSGETARYVGK